MNNYNHETKQTIQLRFVRADRVGNVAESGMYIRWYADNIWLFVPVQAKLKDFLTSLPAYPFQQGSSLNAAGINYNSLQAMQAMKRLQQLKTLPAPSN